MGLKDFFARRKKNPAADVDPDRHHVDSLDYFEEVEKTVEIDCPECAKAQRHIHLVQTKGEEMECPECHYVHVTRRM